MYLCWVHTTTTHAALAAQRFFFHISEQPISLLDVAFVCNSINNACSALAALSPTSRNMQMYVHWNGCHYRVTHLVFTTKLNITDLFHAFPSPATWCEREDETEKAREGERGKERERARERTRERALARERENVHVCINNRQKVIDFLYRVR